METRIMTLFTRTPLHVGAGNSVGAVDSPVMRERHTGFPIIPGSSIKGVLRDHLSDFDIIDEIFGMGGDAGAFKAGLIAFGEARLLAFPVRSAKGAFALATSPLALQRFARDAKIDIPVPELIGEMTALTTDAVTITKPGDNSKHVVLEEYAFKVTGDFPQAWAEKLSSLLSDAVLMAAKTRFVLLSDTDLSYFVQNTCQVDQHVRIDDKTGTAKEGGLFNVEAVPSETLFYAPLAETRKLEDSGKLAFNSLKNEQLIQFGGNSTTGLGFCTIKLS